MIKAVVFDMDDTIFYPQIPFGEALNEVFPEYIDDLSEAYRLFRKISDKEFQSVLEGSRDIPTFHRERIKKMMTVYGYGRDKMTDRQADAFQQSYLYQQGNIQILDGIKAAFEYLKEKGIRQGLLTNGPTEYQRKKIDCLKLKEYICAEDIIISQEVGFSKPSPEIFRLMERKLGLSANELIYVGDNYENDILGGANCGWKTVWINHKKSDIAFSEGNRADAEINSHEELLDVIRQLLNE
ncbi:HAD family hydrolase [Lactovum odontotermitis]